MPSDPTRVLVVANRTACTPELLEAVRERAARGPVAFHLVVPPHPPGLHRLVDPEDSGREEAEAVLAESQAKLQKAVDAPVTGEVGSPDPLTAIADAVNLRGADEIIISTLPRRLSRWTRLDLVSKARGLGLPVTHVEAPVREASTA